MAELILLRGARQLLTLRGPGGPRRGAGLRDLGIIRDGALLIRDGVILDVGPSRRVENLAIARQAVEWDCAGRVVMPGFVDSHTTFLAGSFEGDLLAKVKAVRSTPTLRLEERARAAVAALSRHGTTTLEIKSGLGLDETGEIKILRIIAALNQGLLDLTPTYFGAHSVPPEFAGPDSYVEWMRTRLLPKIRRRRLARFVCCDGGRFPAGEARRYLAAARDLGFLLKVQAGARLALEMEAVAVSHLETASDDDLTAVARSATMATLLPPARRARDLIDRGAAIALASNFGADHCALFTMPGAIASSCSALSLSPEEAICAATINGAYALRLADRTGSLEPGKQADMLLLNCSDYREIAYHFGVNVVHRVVKRGVAIYEEGQVRAWQRPS